MVWITTTWQQALPIPVVKVSPTFIPPCVCMTAVLAADSLRMVSAQEMETLVFNVMESVILITRSVKVNSLLPSLGPTTTAKVAVSSCTGTG